MNCSEIRDKLGDYLEGTCGDEARMIALHLGECERCGKEYDELRETIRVIKEIALPDPGLEFWREQREDIYDAMQEQKRSGSFNRLKRFYRNALKRKFIPLSGCNFAPFRYRFAGVIVILLIGITSIVLLENYYSRPDLPVNGDRFVFNEEELEEIFVNGILFRDLSAGEELDYLSDRELVDVFTLMTEEYGPGKNREGGGALPPFESEEEDIEFRIRGLDPEEFINLMELLDLMPATGEHKTRFQERRRTFLT